MSVGISQLKIWFFTVVSPAVRFLSGNKPDETAFRNFTASVTFKLESADSADAAQTQQGLVLKSVYTDINSGLDVKDIGFGNMALTVSPLQLPTVALSGGSVTVTPATAMAGKIYTLPAYLISNQGDVTLTGLASGQILSWNGSDWVNGGIYYQTVSANLSNATQRPRLNFCPSFSVTDDASHTCTTICIATAGVSYGMLQASSGGIILIGNVSGTPGAQGEVIPQGFATVSLGMGSYALQPYTLKTISIAGYSISANDFLQGKILGITGTVGGAVNLNLPDPSTVPAGLIITIKDTGGNAGTHNITINPFGTENIDGAGTLVLSANYTKAVLFTDQTSWFTVY